MSGNDSQMTVHKIETICLLGHGHTIADLANCLVHEAYCCRDAAEEDLPKPD